MKNPVALKLYNTPAKELDAAKKLLKNSVHKTFRQLKALPIMNRSRVRNCFTIIKQSAPHCMDDLLDFFERNYIGRKVGDEEIAPR
jgi:hypothetical protein